MSESVASAPSLTDPAFHAGDPYPHYRRWRTDTPIFRDDKAGFWVVTRNADVTTLSSNPETFCSKRGVLPADLTREVSEDMSIIYMDPPRHRKYRTLVRPSLARRRIASLEPWIRELSRDMLGEMAVDSVSDFVEAVAVPLPIYVIARLLGVPASDHVNFRKWSDAAIEAATELTPENGELVAELLVYLQEIVIERRQRPADDLISVLVHSEIDGEVIDEQDLIMFCFTLLVAGNETTRNLLSAGTWALATHPDARRALASDPSGVPVAVEEMLRWESPIAGFMRTATRDVVVRGRDVAEGDSLLLLYAAANRDEEVFGNDAESFVLTRWPNPHLAFGIGEHFCLGANLARLEARIFFEELLARHPDFELAADPERFPSTLVRGLSTLPISLSAAP